MLAVAASLGTVTVLAVLLALASPVGAGACGTVLRPSYVVLGDGPMGLLEELNDQFVGRTIIGGQYLAAPPGCEDGLASRVGMARGIGLVGLLATSAVFAHTAWLAARVEAARPPQRPPSLR